MRIFASIIPATAGAICLSAPSLAADLTGAEIKTLYSGKTVYLETTAASATGKPGQGVIFWGEDGTAIYKTPTGAMWTGKWEIKGNTNCTVWKQRPDAGCTKVDKTGDALSVLDAASGQVRAKIVKTAPGNAEKLAP